MNEKPEALRLAERIDLRDYYDFDAALHCPDAAIELRRQHAEIERLREALDNLISACELPGDHCEVEQALPHAKAALRREDV